MSNTAHLAGLGPIADVISIGIVAINPAGEITLWNRWLEKHSSIAAAEAVGCAFTEVFPRGTYARLARAVDLAISKRMASVLSPVLNACPLPLYQTPRDRDADRRMKLFIQVFALPEPWPKGACLVQMTDTTAAMQRETLLRSHAQALEVERRNQTELSSRLAAILDNVFEAVLTIGENGLVRSFNKAAQKVFGHSAEEVLGRNVRMLMPYPDRDHHDTYLQRYLREGNTNALGTGRRLLGQRKSGAIFPLQLAVTEVHGGFGREFIGVITDLTEVEAAQNRERDAMVALAARERFLRAVADGIPGVVAYWDRELVCRFANAAFVEWFGLNPDNAQGCTVVQIMGEQRFNRAEPYLRKALAGEPQLYELGLSRADGQLRHALTNCIPDFTATGGVQGIYMLISDVTILKETQAKLEEHQNHLEELVRERTAALEVAKEAAEAASRAKSSFMANMSHELRTPLHAITGMTDIARRRTSDDKVLSPLNKVADASRHLLALIEDVLDITRIEADRLSLMCNRFVLGSVIALARDLLEPLASAKGLALEFDCPENTSEQVLWGDETRLGQVLLNLVSNAIKFTDQGGVRTRVQCTATGEQALLLRVEVQDTGIGISKSNQERIFLPFEQVDISSTRRHGGTGLGLSICRRLVGMMGGTLGVESQPGVGSTFWFTVTFRILPEQESAPEALKLVDPEAPLRTRFGTPSPFARH